MIDVDDWFTDTATALVGEVDRLWPNESSDPAYRGACLAEEAGEVNRAITKRRHAQHAANGLCKGMTVNDWTRELRLELAQTFGVILDMAHREGFDLITLVEDCVATLRAREAGT